MPSYITMPTGAETPEGRGGGFFMPPRQAGILGASVAVAVGAGWFTYLGTHGLAWACLSAVPAFAGAVRFLDWLISR
jgi:uncharacterized membrane protein YeaQ/YmgE (transglycosylase-associated protein family)